MRMVDFVVRDAIAPDLTAGTKEGVIRALVESLRSAGYFKGGETEDIVKAVLKRELLGSTGIGRGVAIPHTKHGSVERLVGTVGVCKSGVAFDSYGATRGAMGIDAACYRNDGKLGIGIGNFANEMTALYVAQNHTSLIFTDEAISEGIGPASRLPLKFGIFFFDYDLDGRLDLLSVNGHLEEEISKVQQSQRYAQPAQLFWNNGATDGPGFTLVPEDRSGRELVKPIVGRGSAYGDLDNDGDLDAVFTQTAGAPLVLRNDQALNRRWLRLKLVGKKSNRDALGAWVRVKVGDQLLARQIMPTRSYLSQSELPVTIGLGTSDKFEDLEVAWPSGQVQKVTQARVNSLTVVEQTP